jgi:hypothetical protein
MIPRSQQSLDFRQAGPAVGAHPQARPNLTDIDELVILNGAPDSISAKITFGRARLSGGYAGR